MKPAARNADHIITISNTEKQRFVKHGIAELDNISVISLGVNRKFKPLHCYSSDMVKKFKLKNEVPEQYILYVGRLNIRKNIVNLIKSLNYVEDKDIKLVVVGGVDYKADAIAAAIQTNKLEHRVLFTGHVSEEDLYLYYACSKAFCFPSFAEGFGIPPIEAMKCGVPVIVSDRTSLPEICGNAGIYIDPSDPKDIAKKVDVLLSDEDFYKKKQQQSIIHASEFTWDRSALETLNILNKLV
jgi:glycosyltransferase involved in cell wall biosynthesis